MERRFTAIKVFSRVRCMSDGHYWFHVQVFDKNKRTVRSYSPGYGFDGLGYALGWNAPAYVTDEVKSQIKAGIIEKKFTVYECDRDKNERTEGLRYHDLRYWYGMAGIEPPECPHEWEPLYCNVSEFSLCVCLHCGVYREHDLSANTVRITG